MAQTRRARHDAGAWNGWTRECTCRLRMKEATSVQRSYLRLEVWWLWVAAAILASPSSVHARDEPGDADSFFQRGIDRLRQREYDKAIADFDQAIRLNPVEPRFHFTRGMARLSNQDYDKAIADFDAVIRLDPGARGGLRGPGLCMGEERASGSGDRRLRPCDPTGPRTGEALQAARHRLDPEGGLGQGDRRLRPGHPPRSQAGGGLPVARRRLGAEREFGQGDRRLRPGHPPRSPARRPTNGGATPRRRRI